MHLLEGHGCSNCNISLGENYIKMFLDNNKIEYKQQYRFEDCKGLRRRLPFDFAVFNNDNLIALIEYQGIQHYKPVEKFGGQDALNKQKKNDDLKRKYCEDKNIKLIEIPHYDIKNIPIILEKELLHK